MAALTTERQTPKMGEYMLPDDLQPGVKTGFKIFGGSIVVSDPANGGFAVPGLTKLGLMVLGRAEATVDNTIVGATDGGLTIHVRRGAFKVNNSAGADAIGLANKGQPCYLVDDNTVALTSGNGTRSVAGTIVDYDTVAAQPWVIFGFVDPLAIAGSAIPQASPEREVRLVAAVALAAYTNVAGTLTMNANGALATIDGVAPAVGDRILLAAGAAGADNGVYTVVSLGGAAAKPSFTLALDYANGAVVAEMEFLVSEGTAYGHSKWRLTTQGAIVVGTTSVAFYPQFLKGTATLIAGTVTVSGPVLAGASVLLTRNTANTSSLTTGGYACITRTAAFAGSLVLNAQVAAGTINVADISTVDYLASNFS